MKSKRTFDHNQLISETTHQVTLFRAEPPLIKEAIETLINDDFIERDSKKKSMYIYKP